MNIPYLIVGLDKGGAETMLYNLCKQKFDPGLKYIIVSLGQGSYY